MMLNFKLSFACLKNNPFRVWLILKCPYITLEEGRAPSSLYLGQNAVQMAGDGAGGCSSLPRCGGGGSYELRHVRRTLHQSFLTTENAFASVQTLL